MKKHVSHKVVSSTCCQNHRRTWHGISTPCFNFLL